MAVRLESIIYPWTIPEESMYPNSIYFGLKLVSIWVLWGQSIYYVGTWTLRDLKISSLCPSLTAPKCLHAQKMEELLQSEEACDLRQGCSFDGFGFRVLGLDRLDVPNAWGRERERESWVCGPAMEKTRSAGAHSALVFARAWSILKPQAPPLSRNSKSSQGLKFKEDEPQPSKVLRPVPAFKASGFRAYRAFRECSP